MGGAPPAQFQYSRIISLCVMPMVIDHVRWICCSTCRHDGNASVGVLNAGKSKDTCILVEFLTHERRGLTTLYMWLLRQYAHIHSITRP